MFYSEITGKTYKTEGGKKRGEDRHGKPLHPNNLASLERRWEKARKGEAPWPRSGHTNTPEHNAAIAKANSRKQSPEHVAKRVAKARETLKETLRLKKLAKEAAKLDEV